jgi:transglutaminase-like putative cysteine protease
MSRLESIARILGGRRVGASSGLVRMRDALSLIQAALALAAVAMAQSASSWAVALTVAFAAVAMIRPLPSEPAGKGSQRLWTVAVVAALAASGARAVLGDELLVAGVDFLLLLVIQRLFNRQRCREHMQLLMLGSVLMVIAAVIDAELHYPILLALYLPIATLALIINHLISEGERLGRRVEFEVDRYGARELSRLSRSALQVALIASIAGIGTFMAFPRFGVGVFLRGNLYGNESVGFSDSVRLGGFGNIKNDATVVMHLIPLDGKPSSSRPTWHLRGSAFARYQDGRWTRARDARPSNLTHRRAYDLLDEQGHQPGEIVAAPYRFGGTSGKTLEPRRIPGFAAARETVRVLVTMEDIGTDLLFAAGRPLAFSLTPRGPLESRNRLGADVDDQVRVLDRQPGPIQYEFVGRVGEPNRTELQLIGDPEIPEELGVYVEVELSDEFAQLARQLTADARTRLEKVEAVQRYLLQNFEYSLEQPLSDRVRSGELDPIEGFLFDTKAGHCEYFATAMALLLREVDVPTRNVNGFYGAHYNSFGDFYAVRQADAHSWVEVYFEQLGWVTFDPTPPAGRTAGDDAPWFPRLANFTEALRNAYLEYVIDYGLSDQLAMLERIGVERRGLGVKIDWRRFVPWLLGALGLVAIAVVFARLLRRRHAPRRPEVAIYQGVLALMQRRGRGRLEHESSSAWAARLAREGAPEAAVLGVFARLYEGLRFGEELPSVGELAQLRELSGQLRELSGQLRAG